MLYIVGTTVLRCMILHTVVRKLVGHGINFAMFGVNRVPTLVDVSRFARRHCDLLDRCWH